MAKSYAYVGAPSFIGAVEGRLADAGFSRASDVASADIVVTFTTSGSALEDLYFGDEGLVTTAARAPRWSICRPPRRTSPARSTPWRR